MRKTIAESELILNPDGSIYHLNLLPEDIAGTIITVGDPNRVKRVTQHFDTIELKKNKREFFTETGTFRGKRITVISTGIGPDNIDIVLNELDALVNIDLHARQVKDNPTPLNIFRLGTSGSLQEDIPVDSLVIATWGIGLDNLMHFYDHGHTAGEIDMMAAFHDQLTLEDSYLHPYITQANGGLEKHFPDYFHRGITVSCPGFYGPQGRVLRGKLAFENLINDLHSFSFRNERITNFEMETSGIYGLSKMLGHRCLSVNAIIANRRTKTFSSNPDKTVDRMIVQSLEAIATI